MGCLRALPVLGAGVAVTGQPPAWVPALPPRAGMLLILPAPRAGGSEAAWRAVLRDRLAARPGPPD
eukprot:7559625-Pyramimonas_sp.AAC.1